MCVMSVVKASAPPALSTLTEGFTVERSRINVSVKYAPFPLLDIAHYSNELRQLNAATWTHCTFAMDIRDKTIKR